MSKHAKWMLAQHASPYDTVPLPLGDTRTIRLLRISSLSPGGEPGLISCKLHLASLDEPYIALSYRWGEDYSSKSIDLNGQKISVHQNLWKFLMQEQRDQRDEACPIWNDALCINQESNMERNHQVDMMGLIYSSASKVSIWLGLETETYSRIFPFIRDINWKDPLGNNHKKPGYNFVRDLKTLCHDPYWRRAWIVQECVLAAELELRCGSFRLADDVLDRLKDEALDRDHTSYGTSTLVEGSPAFMVLRARDARQGRRQHPGFSREIRPWQRKWPMLRCSDIRDRIYSLLAIMPQGSQGRVVPDYSMSTAQLALQVIDVYRLDLDPPVIERLARCLCLTKEERAECYNAAFRHTRT